MMKAKILACVLFCLLLLAPAAARAMVYMVWLANQHITKVVCFQGLLEVSNLYDPSQYVNMTMGFSTEAIRNLPPSTPVLLTEEQMRELQRFLGEA